MLTSVIPAFFIFSIVAAITPGPSNLLVLAAGIKFGITGGLRCLLGVTVGMGLLMSSAVLGLSSLLYLFPELLLLLKWTGSALLLWLAWKVATSTNEFASISDDQDIGFTQSFALQWVNPKAWIVSASAAASYGTSIDASILVRAMIIGGMFSVAAFLSCFVWLIFGAILHPLLKRRLFNRSFGILMGFLLSASIVTLHI